MIDAPNLKGSIFFCRIFCDLSRITYRSCIICGATDANDRTRLNKQHRNILFIKRGIFVQPGARCCGDHLSKDQLSYEAIHKIIPYGSERVSFTSNEIQQIITDFRAVIQNHQALNFDDPTSLDDTAYYNITGLSKGMISHRLRSPHLAVYSYTN